jgi:hypothetical protein
MGVVSAFIVFVSSSYAVSSSGWWEMTNDAMGWRQFLAHEITESLQIDNFNFVIRCRRGKYLVPLSGDPGVCHMVT